MVAHNKHIRHGQWSNSCSSSVIAPPLYPVLTAVLPLPITLRHGSKLYLTTVWFKFFIISNDLPLSGVKWAKYDDSGCFKTV